jgi:uncharacterized membrane protein YhaH (DUF805 family)
MNFVDAIKTCFTKYADFTGRAARPEYWWWFLFIFLGGAATGVIHENLAALFYVATLLPHLAVGCRRLHDIDKSGWFLLLQLIPVIGWLILLYFFVQPGKEPNRF